MKLIEEALNADIGKLIAINLAGGKQMWVNPLRGCWKITINDLVGENEVEAKTFKVRHWAEKYLNGAIEKYGLAEIEKHGQADAEITQKSIGSIWVDASLKRVKTSVSELEARVDAEVAEQPDGTFESRLILNQPMVRRFPTELAARRASMQMAESLLSWAE